MSITITLYNMIKRRISTKQPSSDDIIKTVTGNFISDSSFFRPTIIISRNEVFDVAKFNYISIAWVNDLPANRIRYYWVKDKVIQADGCLRVETIEDVFATFKTSIYNSNQWVQRASKEDNLYYNDSSLPTKNKPVIRRTALSNMFSYTGGIYIIGCIAKESGTTYCFSKGGVRYYSFTVSEGEALFNYLANIKGRFADFNIAQYFISCYYLPTIRNLNTSKTNTTFTFNEENSVTFTIEHTTISNVSDGISKPFSSNIDILNHVQYSTYGQLVNQRPYHNIALNYGPFGTLEIPYEKVANNKIWIEFRIDLATGEGAMFISTGGQSTVEEPGEYCIASSTAQVCPSIPLVSLTSNPYLKQVSNQLNMVENVSGLLLSGITSTPNKPSPIISSGISLINAAANYPIVESENKIPITNVVGSNGSFVSFEGQYLYNIVYTDYEVVNFNKDLFGNLINDMRLLSTLAGGLVICSNAFITDTNISYDEHEILSNQLNSGIYLE